ncbi:hypothetical protein ACFOEE_04125 [Pseudoalteromonas fenneropenaei]|uniref:Uncharacterized protein n=1 Tax=Pseudoalteromonas fenneropenaei TaxID=1737459 RepID=A0ABV7CGC8_9GAMM
MKTLLLTMATVLFTAGATANTLELQAMNKDAVAFDRAEMAVVEQQGVLATTAVTYYGPKVWVNGVLRPFFVNPTNGNQFCEERGHNQEISGSTITCGEDESGYANYDWYGKAWVYQSTGSKNQCYQLYATIKCQ